MYLPFINGIYSVAPGLAQTNKAADEKDKLVFQIDEEYFRYISNKENCRHENLSKYYCEERLPATHAVIINRYIVTELQKEHPSVFEFRKEGGTCFLQNNLTGEILKWEDDWLTASGSRHLSLFDALASQVQEDLAICLLENDPGLDLQGNYLAALHLCSPNYWAARDKIGKDFAAIHEVVPGMERTRPHVNDMLRSIIAKGPFTRFAWGITTDNRLNHHPEPPPGVDRTRWFGRDFKTDNDELFIRSERQSLIGFPELNGFLFAIRTYLYPVSDLTQHEKKMLFSAITSMSDLSLAYKGLTDKVDVLKEVLLR